jgi:5-carboxymethyl-2-hydroxymuconate isomerase
MGQLMADSLTTPADTTTFLMIILGKLEGPAFELTRTKAHRNWNFLKSDIRKNFLDSKSVAQLQLELTQQKQDASVREYSQKLSVVLSNLNQSIEHTQGMELNATVRTMNELLTLKKYWCRVLVHW